MSLWILTFSIYHSMFIFVLKLLFFSQRPWRAEQILQWLVATIRQCVRRNQPICISHLFSNIESCLVVAPLSNIVKGRKRGIHKNKGEKKGLQFHHLFLCLKPPSVAPPRDDDGKKQLTEQPEVVQNGKNVFFILRMKVRTPRWTWCFIVQLLF